MGNGYYRMAISWTFRLLICHFNFLYWTLLFSTSVDYNSPNQVDIYAIKDSTEIEGSFSLGTGQVSGEQYYYFVTKTDNDFKKVDKVKVNHSVMKEGDYVQPYVIQYPKEFDSAFARIMYGKYSGYYFYEFYLPNDTITTDYNIDLE